MKPSLSAVLIVKNEQQNLARCLHSLSGQVDEIVIVDTGSQDGTIAVARQFTERIYEYAWHQDFSAARNYGLSRASGDWILSLDADETLDSSQGGLDALLAADSGLDAYFLPLYNQNPATRESTVHQVLRLFRNTPEYRFQGSIHEQIIIQDPKRVGLAVHPIIRHHAAGERERNRKRGRNLALLRRQLGTDPVNPFLQYYLGLEWLGLSQPARALPLFENAYRAMAEDQIIFRTPALHYYITALKAVGRVDEALALCLAETERYPNYADLFFHGGLLLEAGGEYQIAMDWFEEAVRSGPPPPFFFHTQGCASFLALFHIGYCQEQLGKRKQAILSYREVLNNHSEAFFVIYPLFLAVLNELGAEPARDYFLRNGDLRDGQRGAILAELFFEAGHPGIAARCLEDPEIRRHVQPAQTVHWLLFSGQPGAALAELNQLTHRENPPEPLLEERVGALLLTANYSAAKRDALLLWRLPGSRIQAIAYLNLIHWVTHCRLGCRPEAASQPVIIKTLVELVENCLKARAAEKLVTASPYEGLIVHALNVLARLSFTGPVALDAYFRQKAELWRKLCQLRTGMKGDLTGVRHFGELMCDRQG
jgi:tetratricopeptide (TPR) repeat protein